VKVLRGALRLLINFLDVARDFFIFGYCETFGTAPGPPIFLVSDLRWRGWMPADLAV
jgi:hypothetical protein